MTSSPSAGTGPTAAPGAGSSTPEASGSVRVSGSISQYAAEKIRQASRAQGPDVALRLANELLGGHGVEYICGARDTAHVLSGISYVNMGDTYRQTIIYDHATHRFYWHQSWGDFIEHAPIGRF